MKNMTKWNRALGGEDVGEEITSISEDEALFEDTNGNFRMVRYLYEKKNKGGWKSVKSPWKTKGLGYDEIKSLFDRRELRSVVYYRDITPGEAMRVAVSSLPSESLSAALHAALDSADNPTLVVMPQKMKREVERIAKENDCSVSFLIRKACESFLEDSHPSLNPIST